MLRKFKASILAFTLIVAPLASSPAYAWDSDFHYSITYLICRDVGMNHEFCAKIGAGNAEWTDQSLISGPFISAFFRMIYHFNGDYRPQDEAGFMSWFKSMVIYSHKNALYPQARFMDAAKKGDLRLMSLNLHSLQDLAPHAGFLGMLGHPETVHWPDRYFTSDLMREKFRSSVETTYLAMVAIAKMLPDDAKDPVDQRGVRGQLFLKNPDPKLVNSPNYAHTLANAMFNSPEIQRLIHHNYLADARYAEVGVAHFFNKFKALGIVNQDVQLKDILPPGFGIDGKAELQDILASAILEGGFMRDNQGRAMFNEKPLLEKVFKNAESISEVWEKTYLEKLLFLQSDESLPVGTDLEKEAERIAKEEIADRVMAILGKGTIPLRLDDNSPERSDTPESDEIRNAEMGARASDINDIIEAKTFDKRRVGYTAKVLRSAGRIGQIMRALQKPGSEAFSHRHEHSKEDIGVEISSTPLKWRVKFALHNFALWLTSFPRSKLRSPERMAGATDYRDAAKWDQLMKAGTIDTISSRQYQALLNDFDSPMERAFDRVHKFASGTGPAIHRIVSEKDKNEIRQSAVKCVEVTVDVPRLEAAE